MKVESRPLLRTRSGERFDAVDVANHLAAWLAPKLLAPGVAERVEEFVIRVEHDCTPVQRKRLSIAAKRWLVDDTRTEPLETAPSDLASDA